MPGGGEHYHDATLSTGDRELPPDEATRRMETR